LLRGDMKSLKIKLVVWLFAWEVSLFDIEYGIYVIGGRAIPTPILATLLTIGFLVVLLVWVLLTWNTWRNK
jgi:phage-related minor tail protein